MSGWYALTVLNTVFVLILMRQVWQLTSLQRVLQDDPEDPV